MICEHCNGTGQREVSPDELTKGGQIVGLASDVAIEGRRVTIGEVLVKGDLSGSILLRDMALTITGMREMVGLEVGLQGARGPLWKGVVCEVVG